MAPHCDTIDGPVVRAARKAIEQVNVLYVLPWIPAASEQEARDAFEDVMHARDKHPDAQKVADRWFYETIVRLHRLGEGAPFTGVKERAPTVGCAMPLAEKALESGDADVLSEYLEEAVEDELELRLARVKTTASYDPWDIPAARRHVQAMLAFLRFAEGIDALLNATETDMERLERVREAEEEAKEKLLRLSAEVSGRSPQAVS